RRREMRARHAWLQQRTLPRPLPDDLRTSRARAKRARGEWDPVRLCRTGRGERSPRFNRLARRRWSRTPDRRGALPRRRRPYRTACIRTALAASASRWRGPKGRGRESCGEPTTKRGQGGTTSRDRRREASFPDRLDQHALSPAAVELAVEDLLPRAE